MLQDPRYETRIRARAILNAAADYIKEHGWCQRALHMNGRVCMMGAIGAVSCGDLACSPVGIDVTGRLHKATGSVSIAAWNDTAGRTKEQVIAALREAAAG